MCIHVLACRHVHHRAAHPPKVWMFVARFGEQERKADSTLRSSRAVPHPSTNRALRRLTSEVRRDPVHSTRYGRQRKARSTSRSSMDVRGVKPFGCTRLPADPRKRKQSKRCLRGVHTLTQKHQCRCRKMRKWKGRIVDHLFE